MSDERTSSLRDEISSLWDLVAGNTGHPLEREYNPMQAALIAAGAATDSGLNQVKRAFRRGAAALTGMSSNPAMQKEAARMRTLADETTQEIQQAGALYQPLKEAFPYSTAIGEALPAAPAGLQAVGTQAGFNIGREYIDEIARAAESDRLTALANALRRY